MKTRSTFRNLIALTGSAIITASTASATTLYWDADSALNPSGGTGNWDTTNGRWDISPTGHSGTTWSNANPDFAVFGATAGTVTLAEDITVGGLQFNTTGYTVTGATNSKILSFAAGTNNIIFNNIAAATITGTVAGTGANIALSNTNTTAGTLTLNGTSGGGWSGTTTIGGNVTMALSGLNQALLNTTAITLNGGGITLTSADDLAQADLNRVNDSAGITSNGGTITYTTTTAASVKTFTETIGAVTLNSGQLNLVNTLNKTAGSQTLTLSSLTRSGSSSSAITFSNAGGLNITTDRIAVTGAGTTSGWTDAAASNSIIGPWATVGTAANAQTDYAVYSGGYVIGANTAASAQSTWSDDAKQYTLANAAGSALDGRLTATRNIQSLRNTTAAGGNIVVNTGTDYVTSAGNAFANGDVVVLGGTAGGLTAGQVYYVRDYNGDSANGFKLAATSTGAAIDITAANTGSITGGITLSTGKNLGTYGILNGSAAVLAIGASGTGAVTLPSAVSGNLFVTAGVGNIAIDAPITDNGAGVLTLVKNGSGTLTLTGTNTYTGGTVYNGGGLVFTSDSNLGATTGALTINSYLNSNPGSIMALNRGIVINNGAIWEISGANNGYTISGAVSGNGSIKMNKTNAGSHHLNLNSTANTFTGSIIFHTDTNKVSFNSLADTVGAGDIIFNGVVSTNANDWFKFGSGAIEALTLTNRKLVMNTGNIGAIIETDSTKAFTIGSTLQVDGTGSKILWLGGTGAGSGTGTFASAIDQKLSTIRLIKNGAGTWNLTNTSNSFTGGLTFGTTGGTLGFASGALGSTGTINVSDGTLLWLAGNTEDISSRLAMTALKTSTFNTNGNNVTFVSAIGSATTAALTKTGLGTLTLGGTNDYTGATTLNAGKLKLDYGATDTTKLADAGVLTLNGGTLELSGGTHAEAVTSTTLNTGGTFITQTNSGTAKLSMGAITFTGGAIDFSADSIATTTTAVTNGILSQRATVAGSNFAMKSGSDIVAYDYITSGVTGYTGAAMTANNNYSLTANGASTLAATTGATTNTLKIANTSTGSLAVDAKTLTVGAILFTGSANYDITTSGAGKITPSILHNYGTGGAVLNLGALGGALTQFGTGKTVLTAAAQANAGVTVNGGTVQFSTNAQLGTPSNGAALTLNNGTLLASDTLTLDNAGANKRNITLNAGGGTLAAASTKTLTVSGAISGTLNPLTIGNATSTGTVTLTGTNTYTGATTVNNGKLVVNGSIATSSLTTVASGATLGGIGTVGNLTIDAGGTFSPGNSPGIETVAGNYIQNGTLVIETEGLIAGTGTGFHDQVIVNGTVTLNGLLDLTAFSGTYYENDMIFILLNDGDDAINGIFTNSGYTQGANIGTFSGREWLISYNADSVGNTFTGGNDIALTAIPEPNVAALIGGLGVLMIFRRRR